MTTEAEKLSRLIDVETIDAAIAALAPPDRLRLAAELMERKRGDIAHPIIERVALELGAALALRKLKEREGR